MIYTVYTCDKDGNDVARHASHQGAPCWGRISTGYMGLGSQRRLSHVRWKPVPRYHAQGIANIERAFSIVELFKEHFCNDGDGFELTFETNPFEIRLDMFNAPQGVTMMKLFMIRNVLEYVGNGIMFEHLLSKGVHPRLAFYIGASTCVSVGFNSVDMNLLEMYSNDAAVHNSGARWSDLRRFLFPRAGGKRYTDNAVMHDVNLNRTFSSVNEGYRKGYVLASIRNPRPPHNAGPANGLVLNRWDAINRFLFKMSGKTVDVAPQ